MVWWAFMVLHEDSIFGLVNITGGKHQDDENLPFWETRHSLSLRSCSESRTRHEVYIKVPGILSALNAIFWSCLSTHKTQNFCLLWTWKLSIFEFGNWHIPCVGPPVLPSRSGNKSWFFSRGRPIVIHLIALSWSHTPCTSAWKDGTGETIGVRVPVRDIWFWGLSAPEHHGICHWVFDGTDWIWKTHMQWFAVRSDDDDDDACCFLCHWLEVLSGFGGQFVPDWNDCFCETLNFSLVG